MKQRFLPLFLLFFLTAIPVFAQEISASPYYGEVQSDLPEVVLEIPEDEEEGYEFALRIIEQNHDDYCQEAEKEIRWLQEDEKMIRKDAKKFSRFEKSYWQYFSQTVGV